MDGSGHVLNSYCNNNIISLTMISDHEVVVPLPEINTIIVLDLKERGRGFVRKVDFPFTDEKQGRKYKKPENASQYRVSKTKVHFFEETKMLCFEIKLCCFTTVPPNQTFLSLIEKDPVHRLQSLMSKTQIHYLGKMVYMQTPIVGSVTAEAVIENISLLTTEKADRCSSIALLMNSELHLMYLKDSKIQITRLPSNQSFRYLSSPFFVRRISSTSVIVGAKNWESYLVVNIQTQLIEKQQTSQLFLRANQIQRNSKFYFMFDFIVSVERLEQRPVSLLEKISSFCGNPHQYLQVSFYNFEMKKTDSVKVEMKYLGFVQQCSSQPAFLLWLKNIHGDSAMLEVAKIESLRQKDVFMQMLLHLNEDLDDDLLHDCLCLLGQEE